jgi:hypothetical protein
LTPNDRWSGWWQPQCWPLVVPLAAVVVVVEALAVWTGIAWRTPGGVGVTPVLPAAALLATLVGWPGLGFSHRQLRAWGECAATTLLLLIVVSVVFLTRVGPPRALLSFIAGATEEELVFRLAAPLAAGGVAAWTMRRSPIDLLSWGTGPRVVALTVPRRRSPSGPVTSRRRERRSGACCRSSRSDCCSATWCCARATSSWGYSCTRC